MKRIFAALCACSLLLFGCAKGAQKSSSQETSSEAASDEIELVQFEKPGDDALIATIKTSMGEFKAVLYQDYAPKAVENFYRHAVDGYYTGRVFFRVIDNFMVQTGDPKDDGTGGESVWQEPFEDEFTNDLWNFRGALSMANSGDTNGSQFFVVQAADVPQQTLDEMLEHPGFFPQEVYDRYAETGGCPWLDHVHTVFGHVFSGMETIDKIAAVEVDENDRPLSDVIIESIEFNRKLTQSK